MHELRTSLRVRNREFCVVGLVSVSGNGVCTEMEKSHCVVDDSIRSGPVTAGSAVATDTGQSEQERSGKMEY